MKQIILNFAFGFILCLSSIGQTSQWQWVHSTGGQNDQWLKGFAVNDSVIYVTGHTNDSFILNGQLVTGIMIASVNRDSTINWVHNLANQNCNPTGIYAINNFVYLSGSDNGELFFDSAHADTLNGQSMFIAKYNYDGTLIWFKHYKNASNPKIISDENDNVYFISTFSDTLIVDTITLMSQGGSDVCITRLDSLGNVVWSKNFIGSGIEYGTGIFEDKLGNIIVDGYCSDSISIDNFLLPATIWGEFMANIDSFGNIHWLKNEFGSSHLLINDKGLIFEIFDVYSDSIYVHDSLFVFPFDIDFLMLEYDINTGIQWSLSVYGSSVGAGGLASDTNGNIYFSGVSDTLFIDSLTTVGRKMFISKINNHGHCVWIKTNDIPIFDISPAYLAVNNIGDIYCGGTYSGSGIIDSCQLYHHGDVDLWFGKFSDSTSIINTIPVTHNSGWNIFPNPSTGLITIHSIDEISHQSISIFDIIGKKLNFSLINLGKHSIEINLKDARPGIYFIKIADQKGSLTCKIIKE